MAGGDARWVLTDKVSAKSTKKPCVRLRVRTNRKSRARVALDETRQCVAEGGTPRCGNGRSSKTARDCHSVSPRTITSGYSRRTLPRKAPINLVSGQHAKCSCSTKAFRYTMSVTRFRYIHRNLRLGIWAGPHIRPRRGPGRR